MAVKHGRDVRFAVPDYYARLFAAFGPQNWWPGRTRFEMIVGAILTQNTAWTNVEKALNELKARSLLTPTGIHLLKLTELASYIRSAGYHNIKAKRLKNFTEHLFTHYDGRLARFFKKPDKALREELLSLNGIGPETADSIMLYAAGRTEFVVDAYTLRIFSRHGIIGKDAGYDEVKSIFTENLLPDVRVFNEYHALIVRTGKDYCRSRDPLCSECPLGGTIGAR